MDNETGSSNRTETNTRSLAVAVGGDMPADVAAAFAAYCDMERRSLDVLAVQLGLAPRTLEYWSSSFGWVRRVRAVDALRRDALRSDAQRAADRLAVKAVETLGELLEADRGMMSPTGAVEYVPDNEARQRAAVALAGMAGIAPVKSVQVSGPAGGPIPFAGVIANVDVSDKSPAELVAMMRDRLLGG